MNFISKNDVPLRGFDVLKGVIDKAKRQGIAGLEIEVDPAAKNRAGESFTRYNVRISNEIDNPFNPNQPVYATNKEVLTELIDAMKTFDAANDGVGIHMTTKEQQDFAAIQKQLPQKPAGQSR